MAFPPSPPGHKEHPVIALLCAVGILYVLISTLKVLWNLA